ASASGNVVRLWSAGTGRLLHRLREQDTEREGAPPGYGLSAMAFTEGGKTVLTAGPDDRVELWDVTTGRRERRFNITGDIPAAASGDGKVLALLTVVRFDPQRLPSQFLQLWDVGRGKLLRTLTPAHVIEALAFSADGKYVAAAGDPSLWLWDVAGGKGLVGFR